LSNGVSGLPAGAICNPGLDAIDAAVHPAEEGSAYYYFCHDSEGNPYYAATMEEHTMNLAEAGLI
ncbi:MAG: endolytic transglycosylase MltG, partial [Hominenteromicrobium sp.]